MKTLLNLPLLLALFLLTTTPVRATDADLQSFAAERLRDAILLYDRHFRVAETGQYLDSIHVDGRPHTKVSSTAATGIGLISLALGDATGAVPDAAEKARVTLLHLLGRGDHAGFQLQRSQSGWYRHWFNARTGEVSPGSREKYSTIDTALLGAGAAVLGSYLRDKAEREGAEAPEAVALADELIGSIDYSTAIRDPERGSIHLVFYGEEERPTDSVATIPFDEYALLPCFAASRERHMGIKDGPGIAAWEGRFSVAEELPMRDWEDLTLLSKPRGSVPSHFTHQFAFHLCRAYAADPVFLDEMRELMAADRGWFAKMGGPPGLWGLGAGSEQRYDEAGQPKGQGYGVARLGKNPHRTASPAVMAGFLAVDAHDDAQQILTEMHALWQADMCRYAFEGLGFLWRCSTRDPDLLVKRVEGIDFSTMMLGLAAAAPRIGLEFFQRHAY